MKANETERPRVLITATAGNGDKIEMLAYPDGGCGLTRNGLPIANSKSVPCEPDQCGAQLLRLCDLG
jgi:hypothetical protein